MRTRQDLDTLDGNLSMLRENFANNEKAEITDVREIIGSIRCVDRSGIRLHGYTADLASANL